MSKQQREDIKTMFTGYRKLSRAMRLTLESYGLVITDNGKHYKITRSDAVGGVCTIPKTSSDRRAGLNCSFYIIKLLSA